MYVEIRAPNSRHSDPRNAHIATFSWESPVDVGGCPVPSSSWWLPSWALVWVSVVVAIYACETGSRSVEVDSGISGSSGAVAGSRAHAYRLPRIHTAPRMMTGRNL